MCFKTKEGWIIELIENEFLNYIHRMIHSNIGTNLRGCDDQPGRRTTLLVQEPGMGNKSLLKACVHLLYRCLQFPMLSREHADCCEYAHHRMICLQACHFVETRTKENLCWINETRSASLFIAVEKSERQNWRKACEVLAYDMNVLLRSCRDIGFGTATVDYALPIVREYEYEYE